MNKTAKIIVVLSVTAFVLLVTVFVKADNPVGKFVPVKGGEVEGVEADQWVTYQDQINDLNLAWARIHVRWNLLDESGSGSFDFASNPYYVNYKNAINIANAMGAEVILTIKGVPNNLIEPTPIATAANGTPTPWPFPCGRISTSQGVDRLKLFIVALLQQLRSDYGLGQDAPPPVHYIELWNEPDAPAYDSAPDFYGCWVNNHDGAAKYQNGGAYYADVLHAVAPYVKNQFPRDSVKFVAGATMNTDNGFLEKVIDDALPEDIDVVSYHQYVMITNSSGCDIAAYISNYDNSFSYIRNYLDNHGGAGKPILISEGAMGFYSVPSQTPTPTFYDCQARFAANLLTWAEGKRTNDNLLGFIWYTVAHNGWRETDLLYNNGTPKPVYYIWRDFGPSIYLPLVLNSTVGGSQSSSMNGVPPGGSAKSENPYPPPLGDPVSNAAPSNESGEPVNPYPAP